jgi:hypothetical protein
MRAPGAGGPHDGDCVEPGLQTIELAYRIARVPTMAAMLVKDLGLPDRWSAPKMAIANKSTS